VWISPHADIGLMEKTLDGLLPDDGFIFKSSRLTGEIDPFELWPLAEIRDIYRKFIDELRPIVYRLRAGMVSPAEALKISVAVLAKWRGFPTVDPDLPQTSLPADWPRREARRLFTEIYDACIPLAALHVKAVMAKHDQACADQVHGLTVSETIDHYQALAAAADEPDDPIAHGNETRAMASATA